MERLRHMKTIYRSETIGCITAAIESCKSFKYSRSDFLRSLLFLCSASLEYSSSRSRAELISRDTNRTTQSNLTGLTHHSTVSIRV
jgi:hypothetical protein